MAAAAAPPATAEAAVDTIVAIATPPGTGGIGIVRLSGPASRALARSLCGHALRPRHAHHARFLDAAGEAIDDGIALLFAAPASYTGEDVVELQGHGNPVLLQALVARCCALGARMARPGEFTERAFLNGRLDLAQAEAVADLIEASTAQAARSALRSLSGEFSRQVRALVDGLIELRMLVEATLDFPEEEIDPLRDTDLVPRLAALRTELTTLRRRARQGSLLRTGLTVVLAGLTNVGKSSLLNRLAGEDRAIVTDIAGTTRDALRETIQIEGIPLHIIDTAGLRETADPVEKIGIERSWREIGQADVVLQIVDARAGVTPADRAIAARLPAGVERVIVENKCDLARLPAGRRESRGQVHLLLSARTGEGIDLLHDELLRVAGWQVQGEDVILARERHLEALAGAERRLTLAAGELHRLELAAEELRLAQDDLAAITGEFTADDLLGAIFGRFCIGK